MRMYSSSCSSSSRSSSDSFSSRKGAKSPFLHSSRSLRPSPDRPGAHPCVTVEARTLKASVCIGRHLVLGVDAGVFERGQVRVVSDDCPCMTNSLPVRIQQDEIRVGRHFAVDFQRTLRLPDDGNDYPLP